MSNRKAKCLRWGGVVVLAPLMAAWPALAQSRKPTAEPQQAPATGVSVTSQSQFVQQDPGQAQQQAQGRAQEEQQAQGQQETQGQAQGQVQQQAPSQPQLKQEPPKNDRLFWALPNYLTVENESETPPMTAEQKFKLEAKQSFDPVQFPFIGMLALISQAENSEPTYGQGMAGYGKRYAAAFGDAMIGSFMTAAALPAAFHQDPRYFQLGHGSFLHRAGYAVSRIFVTRADAGGHQFNSSEVAGNLIAAGIANAYHPRDDRSLVNTLSIWGTDTGWDTVTNVAKEFWPDIRRMFGGRKR